MESDQPRTTQALIVVAGATGELGTLIVRELRQQGATVRALVRQEGPGAGALRAVGAELVVIDYNQVAQLTQACQGADCVISALSGLQEVIVGVQSRLLEAAVAAGVPRFIPSDYSIDFTKQPEGTNRNLDLRREFGVLLDKAPIAATSILNGMFTDLLTGQAPLILFNFNRVLYWGDADQPLDFTTMADTAAFTARAALDSNTPRYLRLAGEVASPRQLATAAGQATGRPFRLFRVGGLGLLRIMIRVTKTLFPQPNEVFPPWQGMQYLHNMFTGLPKLDPLDNARYPDLQLTSVREVLASLPAE